MGKRTYRTELLETERLLPHIFRNSDVGLAVIDSDFRYRAVNPYLANCNGASVEAHLFKHVREILEDVGPQVESAVQHVLTTGHSVLNHFVAGAFKTRPQGGQWLDNFFPIPDPDGRVRQVGVLVAELGPRVDVEQPPVITAPHAILRSWKEISLYVGSCVKTVQRWEQEHHLPVHRVGHNKGAVVFAFKDEVDHWLRSRRSPERLGDRDC